MSSKIYAIIVLAVLLCLPISVISDTHSKENTSNKNAHHLEKYTIYFGELSHFFEKESILSGSGGGGSSMLGTHPDPFNSNLTELTLEIIVNYTVKTNYTLLLPFFFDPFCAYGIKVNNYTDYTWQYFTANRNRHAHITGNISTTFPIDMTSIQSGDRLTLTVIIYRFYDPGSLIRLDPDSVWDLVIISAAIRILYRIPTIGDFLLQNWLLPHYEPFDSRNPLSIPLYIYFD